MLIIARITFLALGEATTYGINGRFYAPEKKFNINFASAKAKFCLSLHYNDDNNRRVITKLFNRREIFEFKADNGNVNFPTQFCLGRISKRFFAAESRQVYLKGNV